MENILLSDIENLDNHIWIYHQRYGLNQCPQINTINNEYNADFLRHCEKFSYKTYVDGLYGNSKHNTSNCRRYLIPDLGLEDVIHNSHTAIGGAGIKLVHHPISKFSDWDNWPDGYIEGFIRMKGNPPESDEWIVWQYIPMKHLNEIIEPFKDKLILLS